MKKKTFLEELLEAKAHRYAVGAFNIFNHLSARAVVQAAADLDIPVILQTSVVTVKEFGPVELGAMLRQIAEEAPVNVLHPSGPLPGCGAGKSLCRRGLGLGHV